jgi:hypothetical protein
MGGAFQTGIDIHRIPAFSSGRTRQLVEPADGTTQLLILPECRRSASTAAAESGSCQYSRANRVNTGPRRLALR